MADETNDKPWPLMVTECIADDSRARYDTDEGADAMFRAQMDVLYWKAKQMLDEEGRMRDVRRVTLVVHNKDEHIVKIQQEKTCRQYDKK